MITVFIFAVLFNPGLHCLRTLNFENLKYVETSDISYFDMGNGTEGKNFTIMVTIER